MEYKTVLEYKMQGIYFCHTGTLYWDSISIFTCVSPHQSNLKTLLKVVVNCPYSTSSMNCCPDQFLKLRTVLVI